MPISIKKYTTKDTFVASNYPNKNFSNYYALFIGKYLGSIIYRSLLYFDLSNIPSGFYISKAEILLFIIRNDNPTFPKKFTINRLLENFEEDNVNYSNQPSIDVIPYTTITINDEINSYIKADITELIKDCYYGNFPNYGFLIKSLDENLDSLVAFYSKNCGVREYYPKLEIILDNPASLDNRLFVSSENIIKLTTNIYKYTQPYDVSQFSNYTWFAKNIGNTNDVEVILQISPNSTDWINDSETFIVRPNQIVAIFPKTLSMYSRLAYKSAKIDKPTSIDIYLQGQF
ncbi:DNRLRE domain-containing protein [Caloranaerobacter sp. TR13]|uniref:DNRLRE domain-containing protein n=1 Tax=Caloranaerobacter sp. TR13 TaxID=1302151 RepID=UPI0006D491F9|nr:DNRLRE domain-containing protein [Caloranaerobacter sp. TR13]